MRLNLGWTAAAFVALALPPSLAYAGDGPGDGPVSVRAYIAHYNARTASGKSFAEAHANIPPWARKYNVDCSHCHTTIPRLNDVGYAFRAAGFRMPEEIGQPQEKKFNLGDYFAARLQSRFDIQTTNQPNGAAVPNVIAGVPGERVTSTAFSFQEFTMYPLSGSWGKYLGSLVELSVSPEDFFEVENAYLRFVYGNEKTFFTSRVGVFHAWEGFGASDRPYSNARTLFQTSPLSAGGRGVPYVFQPWGLDEAGLEIGGEFGELSLRAAVLSGTFMRWEEGANAFIAFPSQTGPWKGANQAVPELGKPFNYVGHNAPDFSANVTYRLHPDGGAITMLYYRGNMATPTSCTDGTPIGKTDVNGQVCGVGGATAEAPYGVVGNADFDFTTVSAFRNNFDRVAGYASYPLFGHLTAQGGYQLGWDTSPDGSRFQSRGAFAEAAYQFNDYATVGARYDWFRPRRDPALFNQQHAFSPYVSLPLQNGLQVIGEYQHRTFQLSPTTHRKNDTLQIRLIYIF
jgi:hypothetical protein